MRVKTSKRLSQTQYYTTQPGIKRGIMYIAAKTDVTPQYIICHDEDLKRIETALDRQLTPLRDWKPKKVLQTGTTTKDILDLFEKSLGEVWKGEPEP